MHYATLPEQCQMKIPFLLSLVSEEAEGMLL